MPGGVAAVVVAGGRGLRAGGDLPKQYRKLGPFPMLRRSLAIFTGHGQVDLVQAVIHRDDEPLYRQSAAGLEIGRASCWERV